MIRRLVAVLLALTLMACGASKNGYTFAEKCNDTPGLAWRFSHTKRWISMTPNYDSKGNLTGFTTVHHKRDIWTCQERT